MIDADIVATAAAEIASYNVQLRKIIASAAVDKDLALQLRDIEVGIGKHVMALVDEVKADIGPERHEEDERGDSEEPSVDVATYEFTEGAGQTFVGGKSRYPAMIRVTIPRDRGFGRAMALLGDVRFGVEQGCKLPIEMTFFGEITRYEEDADDGVEHDGTDFGPA